LRVLLLSCLLAFSLSAQPSRIVSTAPGLTEILYALGAGEQVVGVSEYCQYPDEAKRKPKVGSFLQPNLEVIASLRPDAVLILKNPVRLRERLEQLKLRVLEVDLESLAGILAGIESIGAAVGKRQEARQLRLQLEQRLQRLREQPRARKPRVAFLVGRTPGRLEGMVAVGPGSYLHELLEAAGGVNVFGDAPVMYPKISVEQLLSRQPDVIFEMGDEVHGSVDPNKYRENVLAVWRGMPGLKAAQEGQVHALADSIFVVPGPRFVLAAEQLSRMLEGTRP
jgi:iron complex transport system substrate-binding protein